LGDAHLAPSVLDLKIKLLLPNAILEKVVHAGLGTLLAQKSIVMPFTSGFLFFPFN
jgi:hypothetical protein